MANTQALLLVCSSTPSSWPLPAHVPTWPSGCPPLMTDPDVARLFCTVRLASRNKLRGDWNNNGIGSLDWASFHMAFPWICCTSAQKKKITLPSCFRTLSAAVSFGTQIFQLSPHQAPPEEWPDSWLGYSGALKTPSILNVFAAEEPAKLLILHIPSPPHKCMGSHSSGFEMLRQLRAPCPHPACLVTGSRCVFVALFHSHHVT